MPSQLHKMNRLLVLSCLIYFSAGAAVPDVFSMGKRRLTTRFRTGRIVGGRDVQLGEVPYQLSLEWNEFQFCGASLISETYAITAGHCVDGWDADELSVRVGTSKHETGGTLVKVKEIIHNPKYDPYTVDYDVSILVLASNVTLNNYSQPIPVTDSEPEDDKNVTVTGWGSLRESGPSPANLQTVDVPVVSRDLCNSSYIEHNVITERMLCAGVSGKDSCQGDSGGPLTYNGTLVGIVSWGLGCGREGFPGVYTNVANPEIRKFIRDNAGV